MKRRKLGTNAKCIRKGLLFSFIISSILTIRYL